MTRKPRKWIKLYCYERLHGSVSYQLTEAEQSIWDKLLCLAGLCGNDGIIADHDLRPYPKEFVIHELHADSAIFESTMSKCIAEGRIVEDEQGISITNWNKYQSEYDRQKQYREKEPTDCSEYGEFENVLLTKEEHRKLKDRLDSKLPEYIERLSGYLKQTGATKYKSHYATILNWHRRDTQEVKGGKAKYSKRIPERTEYTKPKD